MKKQKVKVKPHSAKNLMTVLDDGTWEINLTAKPIDGEANAALVTFLAQELHIAKSKIIIDKGHNGRFKTLIIHD